MFVFSLEDSFNRSIFSLTYAFSLAMAQRFRQPRKSQFEKNENQKLNAQQEGDPPFESDEKKNPFVICC